MGYGDYPKVDGDIYSAKCANKAAGCYTGFENKNLSVTDTTGSVSFTSAMQCFLIKNDGTNTAYLNFDTAATTSSFPIYACDEIKIYGVSTAVHAICDTGLTTTLKLSAVGTTTQANSITVNTASITDANVSTNITDSCFTLVRNVGTNKCYLNLNAAATVAGSYPVYPGEIYRAGILATNAVGILTVQAICDTGLTTTLRMISSGSW